MVSHRGDECYCEDLWYENRPDALLSVSVETGVS